WRAIAPALLLRLTLGSIAGLPLGLIVLRDADPVVVRRLIGGTILALTAVICWVRLRGPDRHTALLGMRPDRDLAAGVISGTATASAFRRLPGSPSYFWPPPASTPLQRRPDLPPANNG